MLNFQSCAVLGGVLLHFRQKCCCLGHAVKSLRSARTVYEKIYCMVCWGGGLSLPYRVKPGPSTSFPASIWVAIVVEIWSWNQCGITHHSTHCAASKNVPLRQPAGQSHVTLTAHVSKPSRHRTSAVRLLGFVGTCCVSLLGSWQPLSSAVAASSCVKNTSPASAGCPWTCSQHLALSWKPSPRFLVSSWSQGEQLGLTKPLRNQTVEICFVFFQSSPNFVHHRFNKFWVHV